MDTYATIDEIRKKINNDELTTVADIKETVWDMYEAKQFPPEQFGFVMEHALTDYLIRCEVYNKIPVSGY